MDYAAPLDAIAFTLRHIAGFDALVDSGAFEGLDWDTALAVLEEAGRIASERFAPLDADGDRIGARLADGAVTLPPGWPAAYRDWAGGGWSGMALPAAHGGMGLPASVAAAAMEMWTGGCYALAMGLVLSQTASEVLIASGDAALQQTWLPRLVSGEWTATMALTEPQAGTDVGALTTRAEANNDGSYRLTGSKIFISFGEHDLTDNIVHLVLARLPDAPAGTAGVSMFLAPKRLLDEGGAPGELNAVVCTGIEHKLGLRGSPTCSVSFEGSKAWLVGEANRGMAGMFLMMNRMRLTTGLQGVAIAEKAAQQALAFARDRRQGRPPGAAAGAPILEHPDVLRMVATMRAQTAAIRALAYSAAHAIDRAEHGPPQDRAAAEARAALLTPIVKAFATDTGFEVASLNVQVHGGMGYVEETGAAQLMRDIRVASIYEGTNGVQAGDLVLRKVLKDGGAEMRRLIAELDLAVAGAAPGAAGALAEAIEALRTATAWVLREGGDPRAVLASATPYLKLCGVVICGALLAKGAAAARRMGEGAGPVGREFEALAEVYATNQLPLAGALGQAVTRGGTAVLALRDHLP
jgi:acyl-CoA dehydrogenase